MTSPVRGRSEHWRTPLDVWEPWDSDHFSPSARFANSSIIRSACRASRLFLTWVWAQLPRVSLHGRRPHVWLHLGMRLAHLPCWRRSRSSKSQDGLPWPAADMPKVRPAFRSVRSRRSPRPRVLPQPRCNVQAQVATNRQCTTLEMMDSDVEVRRGAQRRRCCCHMFCSGQELAIQIPCALRLRSVRRSCSGLLANGLRSQEGERQKS
mmetsp:Transcript_91544/g.267888  ORF Transcript_91544/g.267888 Transcript_91544/m.267888 type:complete len:208 (-) Transcript_91544:656-1279(-)